MTDFVTMMNHMVSIKGRFHRYPRKRKHVYTVRSVMPGYYEVCLVGADRISSLDVCLDRTTKQDIQCYGYVIKGGVFEIRVINMSNLELTLPPVGTSVVFEAVYYG